MNKGICRVFSLTACSGGGSNPDPAPATPTATATVSGLDPNTTYYFAVNAYNGLQGPCSNEVKTVLPPSGSVSLRWDTVQNPTVFGYIVHHGKQQSPGPPGDCTYSDVMWVPALP
jgi:hypothetical protein